MALLSPRFLGTEASHSKREALLGWLPSRLEEVEDLDQLLVDKWIPRNCLKYI